MNGRVVSIPIVESDSCPRRVLFTGPYDEAEAFWLDVIDDPEVDPFYIALEELPAPQ